MPATQSEAQIRQLQESLGITQDMWSARNLVFIPEAPELALAEIGSDGFQHRLTPAAVAGWCQLKQAAQQDGIVLEIVSAFRSLEEQSDIIRQKQRLGLPMATILRLSAPPGLSEHHSGCAIDINTPGCIPREAPFEDTAAFAWLMLHARRFNFTLSYPRDNVAGFIYEPWHWFFHHTGQMAT